ncbi:MAG: helix-turn-helix domain-containing protein [Clostridia bacterium]|nr:helix-turn-helix domain-containing protein [Clostridia bacterium]
MNNTALTAAEAEILHLLQKQPGRVYSAEEIYETVWRQTPIGAANVIAVHIYHLRQKGYVIKTVWRRGYKAE